MKEPRLLLLAGPAGAGKSTLARGWCELRERAVHVELDVVRGFVVSGLADPQQPNEAQREQYATSARACIELARTFLNSGYDVALDDVLTPSAFEACCRELLDGLEWRLVAITPSLEETLERSRRRSKSVQEAHSRSQHAESLLWPSSYVSTPRGRLRVRACRP